MLKSGSPLSSCFAFFGLVFAPSSDLVSFINLSVFMLLFFYPPAERVGAHVIECACVIELPELKVFIHRFHFMM